MTDQFTRTRMLLGPDGIDKLRRSRVLLFGIGGVGSFAVEALARAGVGHVTLVDNDTVGLTNLNRQLVALHSTLGRKKTEVAAERVRDICPDTTIDIHDVFVSPETIWQFDFTQYDCVLDAIDNVTAKLLIADECRKAGTKLVSSMGTGNRLDPTRITVCDVYATSGDPLARIMRRELRRIGIEKLTVVCSTEPPHPVLESETEQGLPKSVPGSVSFVPPVAGMTLAAVAVRYLVRGE